MRTQNTVDLEQGRRQLDTRTQAASDLANRGLFIQRHQIPTRPVVPDNITDMTDRDLGNLLGQISIFSGYVEEELAKADIELGTAKDQETFVRARVRIELRDERKLKPDESKDLMETDFRVVSARATTRHLQSIYDYIEAIRKSVQQDWDTVSRRITQRGQDVERDRRGENVGNMRGGEPGGFQSPFAHFPQRQG